MSGDVTVTHDELRVLNEHGPGVTVEMLAAALRMDRQVAQAEVASQSAQERLVMGAFGSWIRHRWKHLTWIAAVVGTVAGGGWKGLEWLQQEAETSVLERLTNEKEARAVEENTKAVGRLTQKQDGLSKGLGGVENKVEANSRITEVLLELHLRDPKTKRLIKADGELKKKIEAIPGVTIE